MFEAMLKNEPVSSVFIHWIFTDLPANCWDGDITTCFSVFFLFCFVLLFFSLMICPANLSVFKWQKGKKLNCRFLISKSDHFPSQIKQSSEELLDISCGVWNSGTLSDYCKSWWWCWFFTRLICLWYAEEIIHWRVKCWGERKWEDFSKVFFMKQFQLIEFRMSSFVGGFCVCVCVWVFFFPPYSSLWGWEASEAGDWILSSD